MFKTLLAPHAEMVVHAQSVNDVLTCLEEATVAQVLLDEATIRVEGETRESLRRIVEIARYHGVRTTLLRVAGEPAEDLTGIDLDAVLERPITGAALIQAMFATNGTPVSNAPLVSQAA